MKVKRLRLHPKTLRKGDDFLTIFVHIHTNKLYILFGCDLTNNSYKCDIAEYKYIYLCCLCVYFPINPSRHKRRFSELVDSIPCMFGSTFQIGQAYSFVEKHMTSAVVFSTFGFAPYLLLASYLERLFLLVAFCFVFWTFNPIELVWAPTHGAA